MLQLAQRVGGGLELDIKGSVTEEGQLAQLVKQYGLIEESIFNSGDIRIFGVDPAARIIYNRDRWEPPYLMYEIASVAPVFGSRRDEYTPESAVAIHDGCGLLMPHAYDAGPEEEVNEFLRARAMGADGVQTNQPEKIVAAAGIPAPSKLQLSEGRVCLVNRDNGLGFPTKEIAIDNGTVVAGKGGCVDVPAGTTTRELRRRRRGHAVERDAGRRRRHGFRRRCRSRSARRPASAPSRRAWRASTRASTTATVISTAADAALTVADPTGTNKLVNGAFTLAQPLQGLGTVKTWTTPTTDEVVTVEFKQAISATEPLRTGNYAKTLTLHAVDDSAVST